MKTYLIYFGTILTILLLAFSNAFSQDRLDKQYFAACEKGDTNQILKLKSKYRNTGVCNQYGETALYIAQKNKDKNLFLFLLREKNNPNGQCFNKTPLMQAISDNDTFFVKHLLLYGADPDLQAYGFKIDYKYKRPDGRYEILIGKNEIGPSALTMAIMKNNKEIINLLMPYVKSVDYMFITDPALEFYGGNYIYAQEQQFSQIFRDNENDNVVININRITITKSVNPNAPQSTVCLVTTNYSQEEEKTPLYLAIENKRYEIIDVISQRCSKSFNSLALQKAQKMNDPLILEILKRNGF